MVSPADDGWIPGGQIHIKMPSETLSMMTLAHITYCHAVNMKMGQPLPKQHGGHLNIKMSTYQYRDPHVKDKTVLQTSYL